MFSLMEAVSTKRSLEIPATFAGLGIGRRIYVKIPEWRKWPADQTTTTNRLPLISELEQILYQAILANGPMWGYSRYSFVNPHLMHFPGQYPAVVAEAVKLGQKNLAKLPLVAILVYNFNCLMIMSNWGGLFLAQDSNGANGGYTRQAGPELPENDGYDGPGSGQRGPAGYFSGSIYPWVFAG